MRTMGRRPDPRERVLGPYAHHGGWRVVTVGADGRRRRRFFEERADAEHYIGVVQAKIATIVHTTETARAAWVEDMTARKLAKRTLEGYQWAVKTFWPVAKPLRAVTSESCAARYRELIGAMSIDSHRNALKMCRTFLKWCVGQGWFASNPMAAVEGVGKRRRGKPQLRHDEARAFYSHALDRADAGDPGAAAALICLLLSLRSESEALALVARDVDDEGRLLWIDSSKTDAGRRVLEVPDVLRPALLALAEGKRGDEHLFRRRDRKWLWDEVARLCTEAEVPRISPHGLRGMHATLARQAGATGRLVADALGHASPRVTEDHYVDQEEAKKAERRRGMKVLKGGRE
jgi:integrase